MIEGSGTLPLTISMFIFVQYSNLYKCLRCLLTSLKNTICGNDGEAGWGGGEGSTVKNSPFVSRRIYFVENLSKDSFSYPWGLKL
jgi:hypothetical protein